MKFYEYLIDKYGYNSPILLDEIKFENLSKTAIRLRLNRLLTKGIIKRELQGTYYIPKEEFGSDGYCSSRDIANKKYISNGSKIYGFYTGMSLLNGTGFTTQVPNVLTIVTNNCNTCKRELTISKFKYIVKKSNVEITKDNVKYLELLELLRILEENSFKEDKGNSFQNIKYMIEKRNISLNEVKKYIYFYPAKVAKRFMEVEYEITRG